MLLSYSSSRTVRSCSKAWISKATFIQRFLNQTAFRTRTDRAAKFAPPAPAEKLLAWPQSEEAGGRLPGTGPPKPDPPALPPHLRRQSPAPGPATYGEAAAGGPLLRQGRVQRESPPRPVLTGEHHHGGLHGAGREEGGVGNAALCPPRPAAAPFIRPRGDWWKPD